MVVLALTVVAAAVAAGAILGPRLKSPAQAMADAAPPPASLVTAAVERRVLAETVVLRGTVVPGPAIDLVVPSGMESPTAVVTAVLARRGTPLRDGAALLEVAGEPLFGLVLPFPLYRDLVDGVTGPDVREVQKALARLGFGTSVTGTFDARTQDALRRFYRARGYTAPEQPAKGSPRASSPMLPRTHVIRLDKPDRMISAVPVKVGAVLKDPASVLLWLDAGARTIKAVATQRQTALLAVGAVCEVVDDVRGLSSTATVRKVGTEPTQADGGTGFPVRLVFTGAAMKPTPNHTVRVTVGAAKDAQPVLAVPVTAVYARPDGVTFVTIVDGKVTKDVEVGTGRSAGGWVEVKPRNGSVEGGDQIVVGSDFGPRTSPSKPGG